MDGKFTQKIQIRDFFICNDGWDLAFHIQNNIERVERYEQNYFFSVFGKSLSPLFEEEFSLGWGKIQHKGFVVLLNPIKLREPMKTQLKEGMMCQKIKIIEKMQRHPCYEQKNLL